MSAGGLAEAPAGAARFDGDGFPTRAGGARRSFRRVSHAVGSAWRRRGAEARWHADCPWRPVSDHSPSWPEDPA